MVAGARGGSLGVPDRRLSIAVLGRAAARRRGFGGFHLGLVGPGRAETLLAASRSELPGQLTNKARSHTPPSTLAGKRGRTATLRAPHRPGLQPLHQRASCH